jgi:hypothetical protein
MAQQISYFQEITNFLCKKKLLPSAGHKIVAEFMKQIYLSIKIFVILNYKTLRMFAMAGFEWFH